MQAYLVYCAARKEPESPQGTSFAGTFMDQTSGCKSAILAVRKGALMLLYGMVWYGLVWYGLVWYGMVWYGMVWYGMVWYGMVWYGMVWYGLVWSGLVWSGLVWYGMVWYGMVWYGMVWYCGVDYRALFRACYFGCLKGFSKSVQVLFNGIEAVLVLTLIILK